MPVLDIHAYSSTKSAMLSSYQMPQVIPLRKVIGVLNEAKISFVLVGLHGLVGWMKEPRATEDVDVVVATKHHKRAIVALLQAFPKLEAVDHKVVTRLHERGTDAILIDVMKPLQQPHREVFKHTKRVTVGKQVYRIPALEMALVMKFAPMTSPNRAMEDKYQDAHDFILMVKANPKLDLGKLADLGNLVYPSGGTELLEMVRRVRAGERLTF